jgi:hypothetical protein
MKDLRSLGLAVCRSVGLLLSSAVLSASAQVALQIGQNFTGSVEGVDSSASPADSNGAAGPMHFVEFINGRFSVYAKTDGTRVQTMTDLQFWNGAGLSFASTVAVTDPRLIYDTASQRWIAAMVDFVANQPGAKSNHYLLAVSQTADPTSAWTAFSFTSDTNGQLFADFPTLGLDENGVYLSGNMFDTQGNAVGPSLVTIPKANLLGPTPSTNGLTYLGPFTYSSRGNILQPVITTGKASTGERIVAAGDLGVNLDTGQLDGPQTSLVLSAFASPSPQLLALSSPAVDLTVPAYTVPIDPAQPNGRTPLADNDARIAASARRVGDIVYATHAIEQDNRAAIRWYKIDAVNNTLIQSGTISDPVLDLFYPSIAANESGVVVIGCNGSSPTNYISSYAVAGSTTNGTLSFGDLTLLKAGTATYRNPDPNTGESRWGDYSATTVDPADPTRFWTIQMIATGRTAWATQITELLTGGGLNSGPALTAMPASTNLLVSWPATTNAVYQLQFSPTLGSSNSWTAVTQTVIITNGLNQVTVPDSTGTGFFRLANVPPP